MHDFPPGTVALVGAGPGDPGLITVRGLRLLEAADVVVYDALSSPRLLRHAPRAEHVYVGKLAARHSMTQEQINALIVEQGLAGRRVVRLKGGDPFVFGRGGEECEAVRAAGVPYLVVPGITAAVAAAAYAGIPITHRDFNSGFTLLTGHEKEEAYRDDEAKARNKAAGSSDVDWAAIAKLPCVAFYMGVKALPRITARLIEHGLSPDTPAATIQWGTTSRQRTATATIATIVDAVKATGIGAPAITIVGRVVSLRETLNWFETRPLFGQTVVVTRTRDQASELTDRLEALGANVLEAPTIETVEAPTAMIDAALHSLSRYAGGGRGRGSADVEQPATAADPLPNPPPEYRERGPEAAPWVVFTSANGVKATKNRMTALKLDARHFAGVQVAVIGDATADAVRAELAIEPDLIPLTFVAEGLADELVARDAVRGRRFVLLRADIARPVLVDRLRAAGAASVEDVAVYETKAATALPPEVVEAVDAGRVDWVTFTSSSTAKNFAALLGPDYATKLANVKTASIGPVTSDTLRSLGLAVTVQAGTAGVDALAASLLSYSK